MKALTGFDVHSGAKSLKIKSLREINTEISQRLSAGESGIGIVPPFDLVAIR